MVDVEKLLAAIAEAERRALAVPEHLRSESWTHPGPWVLHGIESRSEDEVALVRLSGRQGEAVAEHIASHDPAAVLRRCAADRKLVERFRHHRMHYETCHGAGRTDTPCAAAYFAAAEMFELVASGYGISTKEEMAEEALPPQFG